MQTRCLEEVMIPNFKKELDKMYKIHINKNNDYAGKKDPYRNFRYCEEMGVCSVEQGLLVRITDKIARITNLLNTKQKVKDEKIEDTLLDLANYSVILKCYITQRKK